MPANILDKYRRATEEARLKVETVEGQPYTAFDSATMPQRRLDLRPGHAAQRIVSYGYLTDIVHAGGMIIGLTFSVPRLSVRIEGENLHDLVNLLREERITAIQEYIPQWHKKPDDGKPLIETLRITEPGKSGKIASPKKH